MLTQLSPYLGTEEYQELERLIDKYPQLQIVIKSLLESKLEAIKNDDYKKVLEILKSEVELMKKLS